jgi:hypothetical protein
MNFVCQSVRALCQAVKQRFRQRGPGPHPFQGPRGLALPTGLLGSRPVWAAVYPTVWSARKVQ